MPPPLFAALFQLPLRQPERPQAGHGTGTTPPRGPPMVPPNMIKTLAALRVKTPPPLPPAVFRTIVPSCIVKLLGKLLG